MFGYKQNKVDTAKPSAEGFCTWPPSYHCLGQLEIGMKQPHKNNWLIANMSRP